MHYSLFYDPLLNLNLIERSITSESIDVSVDDSGQHEELALPPMLMRNLGDRSYDKRKGAAMEVEALIKHLQESGQVDRISAIVEMLGQDYAYVNTCS